MSIIVNAGVLERAASRAANLRLVATVNGVPRRFRARLAQVLGEEGAEGLWIHLPDDPDGLDALSEALPGECEATFSVEQVRYVFETSVLKRDRHLWVNDRVMFDALLLSPPRNFRRVEQRRVERWTISEGSGVSGQLFHRTTTLEDGRPRTQNLPVPGTLSDLSRVAAGFICPLIKPLLAAPLDEPMVCAIVFRGSAVVLPANLAQVAPISHRTMRVGVTFDLHDPETTTNLPRLEPAIEELDRQQAQRRALGLR